MVESVKRHLKQLPDSHGLNLRFNEQNPRIRIATWMSRWKLGSMVSKWVVSPSLVLHGA